MADYERRRRYQVQGSAALQPQEEPERVKKPKKQRKKRILPRSAVSTLPVAYVGLIALSCICILAFSTMYIHKKTEIATMNREIATLQSSLQNIRQDNQELFNEVTTSTSLDTIEKKALELGMVPATEVLHYTQSDLEYVIQKEDIPNE